MSIHEIRDVLMWCSVINLGFLLIWVAGFYLARDVIYRIHTARFAISREVFDAIHYSGMAFFKVLWLVLNVAPWAALMIVGD